MEPADIESSRLRVEREVASAVDSLEKSLSRFREGLKFRRDKRERLADSSRKVTALKKETVSALKAIVMKTDAIKKQIGRDKERLRELKRGEAVLKGRYNEFLSGRLPASSGGVEEEDLPRRREKFLRKARESFDELDAGLAKIREERDSLVSKVEAGGKRMTELEQKRGILFKKLKIYKSECYSHERELGVTLERERELLAEYENFSRRLKPAVELSQSAKNVLARAEADMAMKTDESSGAWPYP
ncbi:MAG: hypothetical protein ACNS63_12610 [Candidatus Nitrospinota bacterium M3_3B_026]